MRVIGIAAIVLVLFFRHQPAPVPATPPVTPPSAELQALVHPVGEQLSGSIKAQQLHFFYRDFADVVERDNGRILKDTTVFARAHTNALVLNGFDDGPKVGELVDQAIAKHLGMVPVEGGWEPKIIETPKLVEVLEALAWAASPAKEDGGLLKQGLLEFVNALIRSASA